jgi:Zn-finger nucleic acid-binding protein
MIECPGCKQTLSSKGRIFNDEIYPCEICEQVWVKVGTKIMSSSEYNEHCGELNS